MDIIPLIYLLLWCFKFKLRPSELGPYLTVSPDSLQNGRSRYTNNISDRVHICICHISRSIRSWATNILDPEIQTRGRHLRDTAPSNYLKPSRMPSKMVGKQHGIVVRRKQHLQSSIHQTSYLCNEQINGTYKISNYGVVNDGTNGASATFSSSPSTLQITVYLTGKARSTSLASSQSDRMVMSAPVSFSRAIAKSVIARQVPNFLPLRYKTLLRSASTQIPYSAKPKRPSATTKASNNTPVKPQV